MNRSRALLAIAMALLPLSIGQAAEPAVRKPNVVFLLADQWRAQAVGYAGDPNARTPQLDRLATQGVVLTTATSTCPVCSPYRACLITGRYPTTDPNDLRQFLETQNNTDVTVAAQVMYAAARGMAGVRCYSFDSRLWKDERARGHGQTGAEPLETGTGRWAGLATAFNLVGQLEPYLLGKPMAPPWLGEDFVVGARHTDDGRLLLAVNFSEVPQAATVNLSPYQYAGTLKRTIQRYRLRGATLKTERIDPVDREMIEFQPGEAIIWLLRPGAAPNDRDRIRPSVRLTAPLPDASVTGEVTIAAQADSEVGISRVEFFVDGKSFGETTAAPYRVQWNTAAMKPETWHQLTAVAYDLAGGHSQSRQKVRIVEATGTPPSPK